MKPMLSKCPIKRNPNGRRFSKSILIKSCLLLSLLPLLTGCSPVQEEIFSVAKGVLSGFNAMVLLLIFLCTGYQVVYLLIALFKKDPVLPEGAPHRFAVLVAARNEEAVIGQLIDSINHQTYPKELVKVFVVADNCTDHTGEVAEQHGATVFYRQNKEQVGKGYALDFLLGKIKESSGAEKFDGYLVLDADNLLKEDFLCEMNKVFSAGYPIVSAYRNIKNYGDNWLTAGCGLTLLREAEFLNHPRMQIKSCCAISGTGFLFSSEIEEEMGGWPFVSLTEDLEFSLYHAKKGRKIGYAADAILYDEQPVSFSQSWRQRLRWCKGYLVVCKKEWKPMWQAIFSGNLACYDLTMSVLPAVLVTLLGLAVNLIFSVVSLFFGGSFIDFLLYFSGVLGGTFATFFALGLVATISQWRRIPATAGKKIKYLFSFPIFMLLFLPICIHALFAHVEWTPIAHNRALTLQEVEEEKA